MLEPQKPSVAASSSPLRRPLAQDLIGASANRPFISYSHFGLEVFYKRSLKALSEDLRSPYRLILEDLCKEFGLRGLTPPSDAFTAACMDTLRRLAQQATEGKAAERAIVDSPARLAS